MSLSLFRVPMHLGKNQSSKGRENSFCDSLAKISTVACPFGYRCINRYLSFWVCNTFILSLKEATLMPFIYLHLLTAEHSRCLSDMEFSPTNPNKAQNNLEIYKLEYKIFALCTPIDILFREEASEKYISW